MVKSFWCSVQGVKFRVLSLGSMVQCLRSRLEGLGFRV
jgi:hypothetical protein